MTRVKSLTIKNYCNAYPSAVKFGGVNRGRLLETTPRRVFIFFVTSIKHHDIPGFEPDLTEEG